MSSNSLSQFLKFLINGGVLGVASIFLQQAAYLWLEEITTYAYELSSGLAYTALVGLNFIIQKKLIFDSDGLFPRFLAANLLVLLIVSLLSGVLLATATRLGYRESGEDFSFILAALIGAYPSFCIKKLFVFSAAEAGK